MHENVRAVDIAHLRTGTYVYRYPVSSRPAFPEQAFHIYVCDILQLNFAIVFNICTTCNKTIFDDFYKLHMSYVYFGSNEIIL